MGAVQVGMPEEVIQEASRIAHCVKEDESLRVSIGASTRQGQLEAIYSLAHKVACLAQASLANPQVCLALKGLKFHSKE